MSAASRNKGAAAERELLKLLGEELGHVLQRNITQTRGGGADCLEVKGFAIEVKRQEKLSRPAWWRQACEQADRVNCEPMLFYRRNRESWQAWIHTIDGKYREGSLIDAAGVIREKWARLYGEVA
jgi:Holliday junction resolvase